MGKTWWRCTGRANGNDAGLACIYHKGGGGKGLPWHVICAVYAFYIRFGRWHDLIYWAVLLQTFLIILRIPAYQFRHIGIFTQSQRIERLRNTNWRVK